MSPLQGTPSSQVWGVLLATAKLSAGDVVAQELKYHSTCLVGLYNRERAHLHHEELKKVENDALD